MLYARKTNAFQHHYIFVRDVLVFEKDELEPHFIPAGQRTVCDLNNDYDEITPSVMQFELFVAPTGILIKGNRFELQQLSIGIAPCNKCGKNGTWFYRNPDDPESGHYCPYCVLAAQ